MVHQVMSMAARAGQARAGPPPTNPTLPPQPVPAPLGSNLAEESLRGLRDSEDGEGEGSLSLQERVLRREIEAYFSNNDDLPRLPFDTRSSSSSLSNFPPSSSSTLSSSMADDEDYEGGGNGPSPVVAAPRDKASIEIQASHL